MSTIAQTILQQLGGNRFIAMTGARNFSSTYDSLVFGLPGCGGFVKQGINVVTITLTAADDYTMQFGRVRKDRYTNLVNREGVYAEDLPEIFRQVTGLETRMPRIIGV